MRILFVTSEVAGVYKLGGLADVSASLPVALTQIGVDVDVAMPYYRDVHLDHPAKCIGQLAVSYDKKQESIFLFESKYDESQVRLILFRHPLLDIYHTEHIDDTFAFFAKAVATYALWSPRIANRNYDIVHCHDWHTALVPLLLGEDLKVRKVHIRPLQAGVTKSILTIHNILYQGISGKSLINKIGSTPDRFHIRKENINMLREGLEYADMITTVSPTYARELVTSTFGEGLESIFRRRKDRLHGILNGIDTRSWNPSSDTMLIHRYRPENALAIRKENKRDLQKILKLPLRADTPFFAFIGRLETLQKGIGILMGALAGLLPRTSFQVVILGTGEKHTEERISALSRKHPANIAFRPAFDDKLARMIYAGTDIIVVPSKFEPCGLVQMIAMRYGAIPLVRKTGGLADTVVHKATGYVFDAYDKKSLASCIQEAISDYEKRQEMWQKTVRRIMRQDFSWKKSAQKYLNLYRKLVS
ncbi:glycogen synthase [Patescibacteria group bacterium]|nr:glycogen synthase [Patescibacteria group bacterium]MBU1472533.1 glycogen synthase [Patescibacteria group bacterium]MBU2460094.1 glycogen synthase [Patescibacteria group bacterium]MBU2544663.1 glycogen synthase [Patescibacteria group bacterium]